MGRDRFGLVAGRRTPIGMIGKADRQLTDGQGGGGGVLRVVNRVEGFKCDAKYATTIRIEVLVAS